MEKKTQNQINAVAADSWQDPQIHIRQTNSAEQTRHHMEIETKPIPLQFYKYQLKMHHGPLWKTWN